MKDVSMLPRPSAPGAAFLMVAAAVLSMALLVPGGASAATDKQDNDMAEPSEGQAPLALPATYLGTYLGELPCDDCRGIRLELSLDGAGRFLLKERHLGPGEQPDRRYRGDYEIEASRLALMGAVPQPFDEWRMGANGGWLGQGDQAGEQGARLERLETVLSEPLEGRYWKLVELAGKSPLTGETHLVLHEKEGRVAGFTGCNRLMGRYQVEADSLALSPLGTTKMACAQETMIQEQELLEALQATSRYRILGDELFLLGDQGATLARFEVVHLT